MPGEIDSIAKNVQGINLGINSDDSLHAGSLAHIGAGALHDPGSSDGGGGADLLTASLDMHGDAFRIRKDVFLDSDGDFLQGMIS